MRVSTFNIRAIAPLLIIACFGAVVSFGQTLSSGVYKQTGVKSKLNGSTRDLEKLDVDNRKGTDLKLSSVLNDQEQLIIIQYGKVSLAINHKSRIVENGSIAWIEAGDTLELSTVDKTTTSYYLLKFKSRLPINVDRGKKSGSFIIDWKDVEAKPTEKGMRRNFFDLPTGMFERFEMHVTTLNKKNEISHPPHTHRAEEVLLILNGNVEMQIGEEFKKADTGALIFLASESSHALKNIGDEPCTYFAFQWQESK